MPLRVTAAQARRYAGKSYAKGKRKEPARMDEALFQKAVEFRAATAKNRPDGSPCWHRLILQGPIVQCEKGCQP